MIPTTKRDELAQLRTAYPDFSPFVLLKLSMIWHGVVLSESALMHLQNEKYSFGKVEPFDLGAPQRPDAFAMPGPILLRDATFVYINYGEAYVDPYTVDYDTYQGLFLLKEDGVVIDSVDFVPRPAFFGKTTSRGTPMEAVAVVRAQKLILTAYQGCNFWRGGHQCAFCAFFTGGKGLGEVDVNDIRETVQEALREPGRFSELYLSGGTDFSGDPAFSNEVERYIRVWQAIGADFATRFPSQLMAPAYTKDQLQRLYNETKITSYCPNIEIADRALFKKLCPGKEKWIGYDAWLRRTVDAVEVFGRGNVYTQVVAGAELARPHGFADPEAALESNFRLCNFFARNGVIFLSTIWRPHKAARLGFQPMPPLEYYVKLAKGLHDIRRSYGLVSTDDNYKMCGNHPDSDLERLD